MPFDDEAAKAEIAAYKVALAAFEKALRALLPGDVVARLAGYSAEHQTTWIAENGKAVHVRIRIDFEDLSGI